MLLGTKGGPTPSALRAAAANALVIDGQPYLIDCGNGVAQQLAKAGIRLPMLRDIFLTHHHSDHNADLLNVVWLAWASGLHTAVHLYGPPGIARMVDAFVEMNAIDIEARIREEGRPPFKARIHVHEFDQPGTVLTNDQVTVTATLVDHYTLRPAFAYRFEARDRSVVFSGDTRYLPALAEFAKDTDILVHEVMYLPALQKMLQTNDNAPTLLDHLLKKPFHQRRGRQNCGCGEGEDARTQSLRPWWRCVHHRCDVERRRAHALRRADRGGQGFDATVAQARVARAQSARR